MSMRAPAPDFPAAHSMDSAWFAIDDAGEVAVMTTHEDGPLPVGMLRGMSYYDLYARFDKDAQGIGVFPLDRDPFPDGEGTRELEECLAKLPAADQEKIRRLAFDPPVDAKEREALKRSIQTPRWDAQFVILADPADVGAYEQPRHITRIDAVRAIYHVYAHFAESLCLLLQGRIIAWRRASPEAALGLSSVYGIYHYSPKQSSTDYPQPLFNVPTPPAYHRGLVPEHPIKSLPAGLRSHRIERADGAAPLFTRLPGVRFAEAPKIQAVDFLACETYSDGIVTPDSSESRVRRLMSIVHEADAVARERHLAELRLSAAQGDGVAQYCLGYAAAYTQPPDYAAAFHWYHLAANPAVDSPRDVDNVFTNGAAAQCCTADLYERGAGVERDDALALNWYLSAEALGSELARKRMIRMYVERRVAPQDLERVRRRLSELAFDSTYAAGQKGRKESKGSYTNYDELGPIPRSDTQLRLMEAVESRSHNHIFIYAPSRRGNEAGWWRVEGIDDDVVKFDSSGSIERSAWLTNVSGFYALRSDGELVHAEGLTGPVPPEVLLALQMYLHPERAPAAPSGPRIVRLSAPRADAPPASDDSTRPQQVPAGPINAYANDDILRTRQTYAAVQAALDARQFEFLRVPDPAWMRRDDGLSEIGRQQTRLLAEGTIVWAVLIQANELLFQPGDADHPALLVYSPDHHYDLRPMELHWLARRIFSLKNTAPEDAELLQVARLVTDELDRSLSWQLPQALTPHDVRTAACMIYRRHLPDGVWRSGEVPILIHRSTPAVMVLPWQFWTPRRVLAWSKAAQLRSLEEIRKLPVGIRVTHDPAFVSPSMASTREGYAWNFRTTVEALQAEVTVVEFGAFHEISGCWTSSGHRGDILGARHFAEWYGCSGAVLKPGVPVSDSANWTFCSGLRPARSLWYFIGVDTEGRLYRGESVVVESV